MSLDDRIKFAALKARHQDVLRPWYKKWWGILFWLFAALIFVALVVSVLYVIQEYQAYKNGTDQASLDKQRQTILAAINGTTNYYTGTSTPQATIVEFADFACPFCWQSETDLQQIRAQYLDKIKLVWRDYPLHPTSIELALAARCAGEQGKFWPYHDILFTDQTRLATSTGEELDSELIALAQNMDLATSTFTNCLSSQKYLAQVKQDYDDGETLQVQGTPTWFINNYPVTGAMPAGGLLNLIKGLIK